jgi:hypothetical protein
MLFEPIFFIIEKSISIFFEYFKKETFDFIFLRHMNALKLFSILWDTNLESRMHNKKIEKKSGRIIMNEKVMVPLLFLKSDNFFHTDKFLP